MWDDVVIGSGHRGCSAVKILDNVSHNDSSFWISRVYLDLGMTIFKDTQEGRELEKFISEGVEAPTLQAWLEDLLLSRIAPLKLKTAIENEMQRMFINGANAKLKQLRHVLGIEE